MTDAGVLDVVIPFFVGLTSMGCGCSLPVYPGLFMVLRQGGRNPSRGIGLASSLLFSSVMVVALIAVGATLANLGRFARVASESPQNVLPLAVLDIGSVTKIIGAVLYVFLGLVFLLNLECKLTPNAARFMPSHLSGKKGAVIGGVIYGVPASIACSFIFLMPFVFTSIVSGDIVLSIAQFGAFGLGRTVLVTILGLMFTGIHSRLANVMMRSTSTLGRIVGVLLIIFGIYFYLYASSSGL